MPNRPSLIGIGNGISGRNYFNFDPISRKVTKLRPSEVTTARAADISTVYHFNYDVREVICVIGRCACV